MALIDTDKIITDNDLIDFLLDRYKETGSQMFLSAANSIELYRREVNLLNFCVNESHGWTSMEDDKPKKNGYYFCYHMKSKCRDKEDWQINKLYWEDNLWLMHHNTFKTVDYVTHWMPLPEPPKD